MEIFRQLQNQRNSETGKVTGDSSKSSATTSGNSSEMTTPFGDRKSGETPMKPALGNYTFDTMNVDKTKYCYMCPSVRLILGFWVIPTLSF